MGSRQPERYIPDIRDVFNRHGRGLDDGKMVIRDEHGANNKSKAANQQRANYNRTINDENETGNSIYSRTLTEKDLKHIERHLSMKKTIRKQLSRHLSKAFVESEAAEQPVNTANRSQQAPFDFPTSAGGKSNFSQQPKDVGKDDIGHCSPKTDIDRSQWTTKRFSQSSLSGRDVVDTSSSNRMNNNISSATSLDHQPETSKKSNFWKKLTIRSKSKR